MHSLGIFDLAADILNKVFITQVATYGFTYYSWYMRVTFVALLVCNLPYTWSLIIDTFPSIRTWSSEHSMDSTPKFWKESRWTHSYFCCADRRKDFAQAPSTIAKDAISEVDMKHPEAALACTCKSSPAFQRFNAKLDTAVIGRMIGGELEDEIDLDMITSRKVFLDIESAVAVARSQPMPPGYQTEAARMDSAMTPPNSAGLEEGFKSSPHRPSKGEMEVIN